MKKNVLFFALLVIFAATINLSAQPQPPANLQAELITTWHGEIVKLTWEPPVEFQLRFKIYKKNGAVSDTGSFYVRHNGMWGEAFHDHEVITGETYSYYVTAFNRDGVSDPSDTVEITIEEPVQADPAFVSGTVTDDSDNSPVPGVKVIIFPQENFHHSVITFTDTLGNYSADIPPGDYFVRYMKLGFWYEYYDNTRYFDEADLVTFGEGDSLVIDAGLEPFACPAQYTLSGTVTDADNNPVVSKMFVYRLRHNSHHHHHGHIITDSLGNYSVNVIEGDSVIVFARPLDCALMPEFYEDKATFEEADRVLIDGDVTDINFIIEPKPVFENSIAGSVSDSNGVAVMGIVNGFRLNTTPSVRRCYTTLVDSLGDYTLENMLPGQYIILVKPEGDYLPTFFRYDGAQAPHWINADSLEVDTTSMITGIDFNVIPHIQYGESVIGGIVHNSDGLAVGGAYVFAFDNTTGTGSFAVTAEDGSYMIEGLIPGNYTVFGDKYTYTNETIAEVDVDYGQNQYASANLVLKGGENTLSVDSDSEAPVAYALGQNYPNPFNPSTTISFSLPEASNVTLKVFDSLGREVATLISGDVSAGTHNVTFDASGLASGLYVYRIEAGDFSAAKKLLLLK